MGVHIGYSSEAKKTFWSIEIEKSKRISKTWANKIKALKIFEKYCYHRDMITIFRSRHLSTSLSRSCCLSIFNWISLDITQNQRNCETKKYISLFRCRTQSQFRAVVFCRNVHSSTPEYVEDTVLCTLCRFVRITFFISEISLRWKIMPGNRSKANNCRH